MRAGVGLAVAEGLHLTVVCVRVCAGGYAQERERARARERESVCVCERERERERRKEYRRGVLRGRQCISTSQSPQPST